MGQKLTWRVFGVQYTRKSRHRRQIRRETHGEVLHTERLKGTHGDGSHTERQTRRDIVKYGGRLVERVRATARRRFTLRTERIYRPPNMEGLYIYGDTHRKTNMDRDRGTYGQTDRQRGETYGGLVLKRCSAVYGQQQSLVIKPNWRAALCKCKITKKKQHPNPADFLSSGVPLASTPTIVHTHGQILC